MTPKILAPHIPCLNQVVQTSHHSLFLPFTAQTFHVDLAHQALSNKLWRSLLDYFHLLRKIAAPEMSQAKAIQDTSGRQHLKPCAIPSSNVWVVPERGPWQAQCWDLAQWNEWVKRNSEQEDSQLGEAHRGLCERASEARSFIYIIYVNILMYMDIQILYIWIILKFSGLGIKPIGVWSHERPL